MCVIQRSVRSVFRIQSLILFPLSEVHDQNKRLRSWAFINIVTHNC